MSKLLLQFAQRPAFYPFHQIGWTQGRRGRSQYVHVVLPDVPLLDPDIQTETRLPDQLPRPMDNLPLQNMIPVLGYPYQMVLDFVNRMRSASVSAHPYVEEVGSLRKTSLPIRYVLKRIV
jgi:hypothetical protein